MGKIEQNKKHCNRCTLKRVLKLGNTRDYASFAFQDTEVLKHEDTNMSVYRAIVDANKLHEEDTALIFMNHRITYNNLIAQADKISDIMTSFNIKKGDLIFLGANTPQAVSILLACSKIGATAMILTQRTTPTQFTRAVLNTNIPLMFCTDDIFAHFSEHIPIDKHVRVILIPFDIPIGEDESDKKFDKDTQNICTWDTFLNFKITKYAEEIYGGDFPLTISATTGSTGSPKGIILENRSYIALEKMLRRADFNWHRGDIIASTLSTGVVTGTSLLLLVPLMMGLSVLQHPRYPKTNPFTTFLKNVTLQKANILVSPPSLWLAMIANCSDDIDLSSVKRAYTVGESISETEYNIINNFLHERNATDKLRNMYGMSETNSIATYSPNTLKNPICVGIAAPYNIISIFDPDTLCELPFDKIGEVFIHTPTAMREYLYDSEATQEFFIKDKIGRQWVRTGDLGMMTGDGELIILGRISHRFVTANGTCIYPYMLEQILLQHPEVSRIKMVNTIYNGENTYAIHVIPNDLAVDKMELSGKLFELLAKSDTIATLPRIIKIRDSFPKNQGGKVDMQALAQEKDGFVELDSQYK